MKDNIIEEKGEYKSIRLCGLYYKLFEDEEGGCVRKGIDGYPHLKHIIKLWPWDREDRLGNLNEVIFEQNRH